LKGKYIGFIATVLLAVLLISLFGNTFHSVDSHHFNAISSESKLIPSTINSSKINKIIDFNTTLTSNLTGANITIEPGVVVTSDGWNIFANGTFSNYGDIITGKAPIGSYPLSYGGSGGGAQSQSENAGISSGFSTMVPGGDGSSSNTVPGGNGQTPVLNVNNTTRNVFSFWYRNNFSNFLSGAGAQELNGLAHSAGANGIAICADSIYPGRIVASGVNGSGTGSGTGLIGGGGGGVIFLSYTDNISLENKCNVSGGQGVYSVNGESRSGNGGNGQIVCYDRKTGVINDKVPRGSTLLNPVRHTRVYSGTYTPGLNVNDIYASITAVVAIALVPVYYWKKKR
jgi:hypothetical protein